MHVIINDFPPQLYSIRNSRRMIFIQKENSCSFVSPETTFTLSAVKKLKSWHVCNYDYASQEKAARLSHCKRVYILHTDLVVGCGTPLSL